jgi:hypothetical protein
MRLAQYHSKLHSFGHVIGRKSRSHEPHQPDAYQKRTDKPFKSSKIETAPTSSSLSPALRFAPRVPNLDLVVKYEFTRG